VIERVWILLPAKSPQAAMTEALEAGFTTFVAQGELPQGLARVRVLRLDEQGLREGDALLAPRVEIRTPDDQARALQMAGRHEAVHVDARDWRVIPHENLIAAYRRQGTRLIATAADAADAKVLLETLESGVDVVLLPAKHARAAADALKAAAQESLVEARVTRIHPVGAGDRACLDTASLLAEDEGVLCGNASGALFLVASEARESGYVAARPFRVNAGAVHAYCLVPGGGTRYLSELRAGDEVLAVGRDGHARKVVLGRVKIERRPLLLIEAQTPEGKHVATLVQNAETIRLVGPQGTKSVVALAPGDIILVRLDRGGRHFGMSVDETVTER
jgi:3-dehydroquinate synthase II